MNNLICAPKFVSKDWIFKLKNINHGRIVQKYNIISMLIENYFIASSELESFELARSKQDLNAHKKFGRQIFS
jgi:hypothetical protein